MPKQIDEFRLVVSSLRGSIYMAKQTKVPHVMSDNRREVPKSEFLDAVLQYTLSQLKDGSDTMQITLDDKVIAEIKIIDESLLKTGKIV